MSGCNFSIGLSENAEDVIEKAENAIIKANGSFNGDVNNGSFHISTPLGSVNGEYTFESSLINIRISKKPVLLSCTKIQNELQKYLQS